MAKLLGILKKETVDDMQRPSFTSCAGHRYSQCTVTVKGKRCNLGDREGLQVPCSLNVRSWTD